jgi:SAM-dependent methyltransferase
MGYVFNFKDALAYEQWYSNSRNRLAADLESELMLNMLKPIRGATVLDIGCGIGAALAVFLEKGLQVTGVDPSPYMLDIALKNVGSRVDLHRCFAEDLPFDDNAFNYVCLITTLEFVADPRKALEEACRVAKDKIFIGVLNRYAIKGIQRRVEGIFTKSIYNRAHFFGIWELKKIIRTVLGDVPVAWRTVCIVPGLSGKIAHRIPRFNLVQKCPFGAFAGILIVPVPRFRTRPLTITYPAQRSTGPVTG